MASAAFLVGKSQLRLTRLEKPKRLQSLHPIISLSGDNQLLEIKQGRNKNELPQLASSSL
jgi:hypothetical protein